VDCGIKWEIAADKGMQRAKIIKKGRTQQLETSSSASAHSSVHSPAALPSPAHFIAKVSPENESLCFRGTFSHAMDDKCRVSVPSTFRESLRRREVQSLVVTNFITEGVRCLEAYPVDAWREFERTLLSQSRFDARIRKLETYYLSRAAECQLDGSGRILLPHHLCEYAGLTRDIVFSATLHGCRIWDSKVWDLVFQEAETALLEDPSLFDELDLTLRAR